jgi:hypothetical protein
LIWINPENIFFCHSCNGERGFGQRPSHFVVMIGGSAAAAALAQLLRRTINDDPYLLSPRLAPLKVILAKLDLPQLRPKLPPLPKAHTAASAVKARASAPNSSRWQKLAGVANDEFEATSKTHKR